MIQQYTFFGGRKCRAFQKIEVENKHTLLD